jgi:hypothetical protein
LPENNTKRNHELITEIFKCIMDCLGTSDIFTEQSSNIQNVSQNIVNLIDYILDKVWDGEKKKLILRNKKK